MSFGGSGTGDGQFDKPLGIAVSSGGYVYVVDNLNNRVQKFDGNGTFIAKWGSFGSDDGEFNYPQDIAVATNGYIYVADSGNCRIQIFDDNGNFISKWGTCGYEDGQFGNILAIAVAPDSSVYTSDFSPFNGIITRIQKFDNNGNFIKAWNSFGNYYFGISISDDGTEYIADTGNSHILKKIAIPAEVVSETLFETTLTIN